MRFAGVSLALLVALAAAPSARAEGIQNLVTGLNGILTFPADPVMQVYLPPEKLEDMPLYSVTGRIAGLFAGTLQGAHRALAGVYDVVLSPFVIFPVLSPQPRYELVPGIEYEDF